MEICSTFQNQVLYMRVSGDIDEHSAARVRRRADALAEEFSHCKSAVFDLKDVSFMDSTGIGFLIGRDKTFRRIGVPVYIVNPSMATDRILQMSGVYTLMPRI